MSERREQGQQRARRAAPPRASRNAAALRKTELGLSRSHCAGTGSFQCNACARAARPQRDVRFQAERPRQVSDMESQADEPRTRGARCREHVQQKRGLVQLPVVLVAAGSGDLLARDQQARQHIRIHCDQRCHLNMILTLLLGELNVVKR